MLTLRDQGFNNIRVTKIEEVRKIGLHNHKYNIRIWACVLDWMFSLYILHRASPQHSPVRCASTCVYEYITNKFSYKSFPYFLIFYHAIMVPVVPLLYFNTAVMRDA